MLLIYGSPGYTGRLIVDEAVARGLRPVLAARNGDAVRAQAEPLGLAWRAAALDDAAALDRALDGATVVLHCAGPFAQTWKAMSDACLRRGAHYLDITGEILVFERLAARDAEARAAGVMLLPGVGFDVVPSDCLAAHLARRLPDATRLALAFRALGGMSRGTLLTTVANLGTPGAVRRGGRIVPVPPAWRTRRIDFGDGRVRDATTIPWGDVSTAWHSTGMPDVEVYMTMAPAVRRAMRWGRWMAPLLRSGVVRGALARRVRRGAPGPDAAARARGTSLLWGEAVATDGRRVEARLRGPEAYTLTARTAVHLAAKALGGDAPPGFHTPSRAYGADVILEIPGVERTDVV
ncbi:Saccharopine dehydrogenase (plasmid) [Gemmatirosa kalamazoonensis]|uniref:Saccharopine dehydrogenase n=1 Tax=Gemmatirosa kalamazoonensis TaxID=861299 RepID=W0RP22_9BACT|nr:saccharopine dehydrogenase NADP-binding domain-containing protein [Gemmatirosa kalamazoonensis]AHG92232.1 Saccharopine dehydrogenase [Gemmatirosa kalamazoonensis]